MVNKVILIGRVANDLVLTTVKGDYKLCRFTIVVNSYNREESKAAFINCVVWGQQAINFVKYMKKGSLVYVEGRIDTSSYKNKEGNTVYQTNIVANTIQYLDSRNNNNNMNQPSAESTKLFKNQNDKLTSSKDEEITYADDINWGEDE